MYLYRAVDSQGNTLEFLLSPTRDAEAAKRFFLKAFGSSISKERMGTSTYYDVLRTSMRDGLRVETTRITESP